MGVNEFINKGHFLWRAIRFSLLACSIRMSQERNLYVDAIVKGYLLLSHSYTELRMKGIFYR